MARRPLAVIDANVLFSFGQRGFFLFCATEGLFTPLWSEDIIEETSRHLRDKKMDDIQLHGLLERLRAHFSEAWGYGFQGADQGMELPDEGDRHVVALAIYYQADYIVTTNTKDFPADALREVGVEVEKPDDFASTLYQIDPARVFRSAENHRCSLTKGIPTRKNYLESLANYGRLPLVARHLSSMGFEHLAADCP
jgi:predicted nucleic acid-binding protein